VTPEKRFAWAIWDESKIPFGDELAYTSFEAALDEMRANTCTILGPVKAAIIESDDFDEFGPKKKTYHYFDPKNNFWKTDKLTLVRKDVYQTQCLKLGVCVGVFMFAAMLIIGQITGW